MRLSIRRRTSIVTVSLDLTIQWLNATAAQVFGYQPSELIGRPIGTLLQNENDLTTSFLETAHNTGHAGNALQIIGRRRDGCQIPFEMSMGRWKADDRVFITTIWRDVTDRILVETALRESEAQLRRNNEELETRVAERTREREAALAQLFELQKLETIGQLTGGVAHDFNNLLSVILGSLALLKKRLPNDARTTRLINGAIQGAERGATLTKRLLAFARRQELKLEATELQALVSDMVDFLRQSVGPGVQIAIDIPHDVDPVRTDANQLELALMNLAVNGRDAMPEGGTLTIACRNEINDRKYLPASLPAGEFVRLTVADTGEGMDEATRARAMEPFFTTKGIGKGTGLGLSMVHGLTAQTGGAMDIASAPGKGTIITLWLPRAKHEDIVPEVTKPSATAPELANRALRILLVDDDVLVSMNTANMLMDLGHDVVEVHSATNALRVHRSGARVRRHHHRLRHAWNERPGAGREGAVRPPRRERHSGDRLRRIADELGYRFSPAVQTVYARPIGGGPGTHQRREMRFISSCAPGKAASGPRGEHSGPSRCAQTQ